MKDFVEFVKEKLFLIELLKEHLERYPYNSIRGITFSKEPTFNSLLVRKECVEDIEFFSVYVFHLPPFEKYTYLFSVKNPNLEIDFGEEFYIKLK